MFKSNFLAVEIEIDAIFVLTECLNLLAAI